MSLVGSGGSPSREYLQDEAGAVFGRATVLVVSLVAAGGQELLWQVTGCCMQLDTFETGFNRQAGRGAVFSDNMSNFRNGQCVRGDEILQTTCSISLTRCLYRRRSLGLCAVRQERWMGHSSTVHQLHEDATAASMNGASDFLPGGHLVSGFDTRGAYVAFTHGNRNTPSLMIRPAETR